MGSPQTLPFALVVRNVIRQAHPSAELAPANEISPDLEESISVRKIGRLVGKHRHGFP